MLQTLGLREPHPCVWVFVGLPPPLVDVGLTKPPKTLVGSQPSAALGMSWLAQLAMPQGPQAADVCR